DHQLAQWLRDRALARQDRAEARRWAERLFWHWPGREGFRDLKKLMPEADWPAAREAIFRRLQREKRDEELIELLLDEGEAGRALELVQKGRGRSQAVEVARAVREARPADAAEILCQAAEAQIEQRHRGAYQEAAQLLREARPLYERLGRGADWAAYLADL